MFTYSMIGVPTGNTRPSIVPGMEQVNGLTRNSVTCRLYTVGIGVKLHIAALALTSATVTSHTFRNSA
jgi:hypothetical protein